MAEKIRLGIRERIEAGASAVTQSSLPEMPDKIAQALFYRLCGAVADELSLLGRPYDDLWKMLDIVVENGGDPDAATMEDVEKRLPEARRIVLGSSSATEVDEEPFKAKYSADILLTLCDKASPNNPRTMKYIESLIPFCGDTRRSWDELRDYNLYKKAGSGGVYPTEKGKKRANQFLSELD